jgi:predicted small secreted protein
LVSTEGHKQLMQVSTAPEISDYKMTGDISVFMRKPFYYTALNTIVLLVAGIVLQGCETTEGFGRDVASAGQAVTETAQENKEY